MGSLVCEVLELGTRLLRLAYYTYINLLCGYITTIITTIIMISSKLTTAIFLSIVALSYCDMMRKSIVFDKATPDVFYCPIDKPTTFEKMFVRSKPLSKLCEFNGKGLPELQE